MIHSAGSDVLSTVVNQLHRIETETETAQLPISTLFSLDLIPYCSGPGFASWRRWAKAMLYSSVVSLSVGRGTVERCFSLGEILLRTGRYISTLISHTYANFNDLLPQLIPGLYDIAIWGFLRLLVECRWRKEVFPFRISLFFHFPSGWMMYVWGWGWHEDEGLTPSSTNGSVFLVADPIIS